MSEWVPGIDVSIYGGIIDQAHWDALYRAGQRVAVIGSAHPRPNTYALDNFERAQRAGFILATYMVVYPGVSSATTVETAKRVCGRFWDSLAFVGVDVETDGVTTQQVKDALAALGPKRACIYSGAWFWEGHFGNPQDFKGVPLWTANYRPTPAPETIPLYGGWQRDKLIGHQYAGTVSLEGVTVDRNVFRADFVMAPPQGGQEEPDVDNQARQWMAVAALFEQAAGYALQGKALPADLLAAIRYLTR